MRRHQKWIAAGAVAVLLVGLFAFGPVRSLAAELLQIFRVDQVKVVRFDPAEVQQLANALLAGGQKVDLSTFGTFSNEPANDSRLVDANTVTIDGKSITMPAALGAYRRAGDLQLGQGVKILATPKVAGINSFLASLGSKSPLPDNLDGKAFTVKVPGVVNATFAKPGDTVTITLRRSLSPSLSVPAGVNVEQVRKALLDIPILPEGIRNTLAGMDIGGGTLLVPDFGVSRSGGSVENVTVNGNQGVLVRLPAQGPEGKPLPTELAGRSVLIWSQNGVWNCLTGDFSANEAITLAASVN